MGTILITNQIKASPIVKTLLVPDDCTKKFEKYTPKKKNLFILQQRMIEFCIIVEKYQIFSSTTKNKNLEIYATNPHLQIRTMKKTKMKKHMSIGRGVLYKKPKLQHDD